MSVQRTLSIINTVIMDVSADLAKLAPVIVRRMLVGELNRRVRRNPTNPVVLTGGCFANERLVREVLRRLEGLEVHLPGRVPPVWVPAGA